MLNNIFTDNKQINHNSYKIHQDVELESVDPFDVFYETLMLEEAKMSEEVLKMNRYFYLAETTGDYEIVQESFGSFCDKAAEFFKKLGETFKQHFGQMYTLIMISMGKGAEYFNQNKDIILRKNVSFSIMGNKYTYKQNIPNLKRVDELIKDYNSEVHKIKGMKKQDINERREKFLYDLPQLRGQLLETTDKIPEGEFTTYCTKFFRDGEDSEISLDINQKTMRDMIDRMLPAKKELEEYKKEAKKIKEQLHALVKYFEDFKVRWKDGMDKSTTLHELQRKDDKISKVEDKSTDYSVSDTSNFELINAYLSFRELESKTLETSYITIINEKMRALRDEVKLHEKVMKKWTTTPEQGPDVVSSVEKEAEKNEK